MTYVMSDVHGQYGKYRKMLDKIGMTARDELCVLGAAEADVDKREALYKEAINIILDECATATVACPKAYFLATPALKGYAPNASSTSNFAGVTLEK